MEVSTSLPSLSDVAQTARSSGLARGLTDTRSDALVVVWPDGLVETHFDSAGRAVTGTRSP